MSNETIQKFGYPGTLLGDYKHWVVLLRPEQVTLGALVMACKGEVERVSDVGADAFAELATVTSDIETTLAKLFHYDKINYVLYMMVDKHVHWHVVPRYAKDQSACGVTFHDSGWPKLPVMPEFTKLTPEQFEELHQRMSDAWPTR